MNKEAKSMINMAESIAMLNRSTIERMDLQLTHMGFEGKYDYYCLTVWYSDGKEIRIREDCTIIIDDIGLEV